MTKQSRRNETMRRDGEPSQGLTYHARNADRPRQALAQAFVFQWSAVTVEGCVISQKIGDFVVTGRSLSTAPQSLCDRRQQLRRQRESTSEELRENVRGDNVDVYDDLW